MSLTARHFTFALLFLCTYSASADQFITWSGYEIHYSSFSSLIIPEDVAEAHGITRARGRIVTNISIKQDGESVEAIVTGTAENLLNQVLTMDFSEVKEQGAIYYLANQVIGEKDTINFSIVVQPANQANHYELHFMRRYY
jgi:Domain of unknown function (DUF4426)